VTSRISPEGIRFIQGFESCRLTPYLPTPNDRPTIGWGLTHYPDGRVVTLQDRPITQREADDYFAAVLRGTENAVKRLVEVDLDQHEFDALVSLVYNIGVGAFTTSTLLRKLNAGDYDGAAAEFPRWNKQAGRVLRGLTRRRAEEQAMFLRARHSRETPMPQTVETAQPSTPSNFRDQIIQGTGIAGTAATVTESAREVATNLGVAAYLPYITAFFVALVVIGLGVWVYRRHMSQQESK
jgi:lysozyme